MKQRLEEFIKSNREEFDNDLPSAELWKKIEKQAAGKLTLFKKINLFTFSKLAAASIIILVISFTLFLLLENKRLKEDLTANQRGSNKQLLEEKSEAAFYDQQINQFIKVVALKQDQLSIISTEYPNLYHEFITDSKVLREEYKGLKEELIHVPEQEKVLDAMIQNLRLQAELLNRQLQIIQQLKQSKKQNNEKANRII